MPAQQIDTLLDIWGDSLCRAGSQPLFKNHKDLYKTIDMIQEGTSSGNVSLYNTPASWKMKIMLHGWKPLTMCGISVHDRWFTT